MKTKAMNKKLTAIYTFIATCCIWAKHTYLYADIKNPESVTISDDVDPDTVMGNVVGLILEIAKWGGAALAVFGFIKLVLCFVNQESDQIFKSVMFTFAGIVLFVLKDVLSGIGIIGS